MFKIVKDLNGDKNNEQHCTVDCHDKNYFFTTIGEKLAMTKNKSADLTNIPIQKQTRVLQETNADEVFETVRHLKNKNFCDMFQLSSSLLKAVNPATCELLASVFNKCVEKTYYPKILKTAKVIPIFKSREKDNTQNYRPLSLLPVIGKVFEKLICARIYCFLVQHNILSERQFGFRNKRSTVAAIAKLTEHIRLGYWTYRLGYWTYRLFGWNVQWFRRFDKSFWHCWPQSSFIKMRKVWIERLCLSSLEIVSIWS